MADQKISDMTAATEVSNVDIAPIVQAGTNKQASREMFLTGAAGEVIALQEASGQQAILGIVGGATSVTVDDAAGTVTIISQLGIAITAGGPTGVLTCTNSDGSNPFFGFASNNGGDWATSLPTNLADAVNRIAHAVAGLLGTGIP